MLLFSSPKMNFIPVTVVATKAKLVTYGLPGGSKIGIGMSGEVPTLGSKLTLGIRPEHIALDGKVAGSLKGIVRAAEYLGSETMFYATLADGSDVAIKAGGLASEKNGEALHLTLSPEACHLFDADGKTIHNGDLTR